MTVLRTTRLELLPFARADLAELHALLTDVDVRRYLLDDEIVSRAWVEREIDESGARADEGGCGLWSVRLKGAPAIIGFVGYRPFYDPPELQLLYGFLASHWGRGLATEAAAEAVRHAFEDVGLDSVRAATDTPNTASIRVLERLGLEEWKRTVEGPSGTIYFRIGRTTWDQLRE